MDESTSPQIDRRLDTSRVTIVNRPRFTPTEALILNLLHNNHPEIVPMQEIQRYIRPMVWTEPNVYTIGLHVTGLRAKLGEVKRHPKQIVSIFRTKKDRKGVARRFLFGYRWVEPGETFIDLDEGADA